MNIINKNTIENIVDDKRFVEEANDLLNHLIDLELEKEDDDIDFDFIDKCSEALIEINSGNDYSKENIISLVQSRALDKKIIKVTKRNINAGIKVLLIAAVLLATTISVNAAVGSITGKSIAENISSAVEEHKGESTTASPSTTKKKADNNRALVDSSIFVYDNYESTSNRQKLVSCEQGASKYGDAISYEKTGDVKFDPAVDDPEKADACDFDEEEYKQNNCPNLNDCINGEAHSFSEWTIEKSPSCTELGLQVRSCNKCGLTQQCPVRATDVHDYYEVSIDAAVSSGDDTAADGVVDYVCSFCDVSYRAYIPYAKYVVVDENIFSYDGNEHIPLVVAVLDRHMNEIPSSYYTVQTEDESIECGRYTLAIHFNSPYYSADSDLKINYKITPPRITMKGIDNGIKNSACIFWDRTDELKSCEFTAFELQYSYSSDFSNAKTVVAKKAGRNKKLIRKLKAGKTYYIRIRTVKELDSGNLSSPWSEVRKIKIR